ncbi:hypothetical protein DXT74_16035 [Chromobacterium sp. Rain0013]|nr:hypothetical protein DXT74_16035 [Chromobacterium sp. Rain0013]
MSAIYRQVLLAGLRLFAAGEPVPHTNAPDARLGSLLGNYKKSEDLIGENGLLKQLTTLLLKKALDAEMATSATHSKHGQELNPAGNTRNGKSGAPPKGEFGEFPTEVPRNRQGTFEPQLIPKNQTR